MAIVSVIDGPSKVVLSCPPFPSRQMSLQQRAPPLFNTYNGNHQEETDQDGDFSWGFCREPGVAQTHVACAGVTERTRTSTADKPLSLYSC